VNDGWWEEKGAARHAKEEGPFRPNLGHDQAKEFALEADFLRVSGARP